MKSRRRVESVDAKMEDSSEFPYELNATYYGALDDEANPKLGEKDFYVRRQLLYQ